MLRVGVAASASRAKYRRIRARGTTKRALVARSSRECSRPTVSRSSAAILKGVVKTNPVANLVGESLGVHGA